MIPRAHGAARSTTSTSWLKRTHAMGTAIGVASLLILAGCSSSDSPNSASSTSTASDASAVESSASASTSAPYTGLATSNATEADANTAATPAPGSGAPESVTPLPTTEIPPPGGAGDINQTVPSATVTSNPPVQLSETANYGNGVTVALTGIESVTTTAELPGEVAGPGVKLTVSIVNGSPSAVDLGNVVVDLQDAAGTPAIFMSASPSSPFTGSVEAGATATGTYVYSVPATYTNPATISVSYSTEVPVVVFVGDAK